MKTAGIATIVLFCASLSAVPLPAAIYTLSGSMDPLQAEPNGGFGAFDATVVGAGLGSGTITGGYDSITNLLNYNISFANLSSTVTNMHFHLGAPGVSGGVSLGIPAPFASPEIGSNILLSDVQETQLLANNWYVNVHTSNFPVGEIRGQVTATAVPEPSAAGVAGLGMLAGWLRRRRR